MNDEPLTVGRRIAAARKKAGLSQQEVADHLGIARVSVTQWESDRTLPESGRIGKLAQFLGTTVDWLVTGLENLDDPQQSARTLERIQGTGKFSRGIFEVDVRAGLGGGGVVDRPVMHNGEAVDPVKPEVWYLPPRFIREELRAPETRIIILETQGDSMMPTIASGDRVIIDTGQTAPTPDGLYAIRDRYDGIQIKRLQVLRRGDPPRILIISDNESHENEEVGADEIAIVGRVLWGLKRL